MASIEDYEKALEFYAKGKYRISQEFFRRTIDHLKKSGKEDTADHILVLKKYTDSYICYKSIQLILMFLG